MVDNGLLTGIGATTEITSGVSFWNRYGRTLYNASVGQLAYNASYPNGTARAPVVLRTTSQSRIENSQINWALGFFGSSYQTVPNPSFTNITDPYEVVIITEGGTENNTLASYDSCINAADPVTGYLGDLDLFPYLSKYLTTATARLQKYAPQEFTLNVNDTYAMQSICAYVRQFWVCFLGSSGITPFLSPCSSDLASTSILICQIGEWLYRHVLFLSALHRG